MAELELQRGVNPDIRTHAENIIAGQQHQIDQFTGWLDDWYDLTPDEAEANAPREARREMAMMERETQRTIRGLRRVSEGSGFDVAFVRRMVPHHSAGVVKLLEPQARAVHPGLRVAAAGGINPQEAEIVTSAPGCPARRGSTSRCHVACPQGPWASDGAHIHVKT